MMYFVRICSANKNDFLRKSRSLTRAAPCLIGTYDALSLQKCYSASSKIGIQIMPSQHHQLIILGSGPAGYTAAVYAARANLKPVLIAGMEPGGQLMTTTDVDNWPADADGVQGPELMARFQKHAERFNTEMIFDHIHTAKLQQKPFLLVGDSGS